MKNFAWFASFSFVFVSHAFGQSPLLWERQRDVSGAADVLQSVSTIGNTAVTAGNASVTGGLDLSVQNYSANGDLRWADQTPLASNINTRVFTASAGINSFVAGYKSIIPDNSDIFVRGYNTITGNVLWSDFIDKGTNDLPQGLAASPSAVVVVGYGGNTSSPNTGLNALIRAYNPETGRVLWENVIDKGDKIDDIAWAVCIDGDEVFVAGTSNVIGETRNMIVRGYNASTGQLLWEIRRPGISPTAITARLGRLFVAGSTNSNIFLAAFKQSNGRLIWEDTRLAGSLVDVQVEDHRVVAVGTSSRGSLVRVYQSANGRVIWQHRSTPDLGFQEYLSAVDLGNDVVYVTGTFSSDFSYSEFLVRAYDLSNGDILLDDKSHRSGGSFGSSGSDIAISPTIVYAVGAASDRGASDFLIRAYDRRAIEPKRKLFTLILQQRAGMEPNFSDYD
jgi:PQQ-like domain